MQSVLKYVSKSCNYESIADRQRRDKKEMAHKKANNDHESNLTSLQYQNVVAYEALYEVRETKTWPSLLSIGKLPTEAKFGS